MIHANQGEEVTKISVLPESRKMPNLPPAVKSSSYTFLFYVSKLAKVFQLSIGYVTEAFTVNRLCPSQLMSRYIKTLLKLDR